MLSTKKNIEINILIKGGLDKESASYLIKNKTISPDEVNHLLSIAQNPLIITPTKVKIPHQTKDGKFVRKISKESYLSLCHQVIKFIKEELKNL